MPAFIQYRREIERRLIIDILGPPITCPANAFSKRLQ